MRYRIAVLLVLISLTFSPSLSAEGFDSIPEQTNELYHTGSGAHEGMYTSLGASMFMWGISLAAAIGILSIAIPHSSHS